MTFTDAIKSCIGKYATFGGRAPRSEYWWFALFYMLVAVCLQAAFFGIGIGMGGIVGAGRAIDVCSTLLVIVFFMPSLAVMVRRLHDTGRSGWWALLCLVPIVGSIWLLVLMMMDSDEENRYGLPVY